MMNKIILVLLIGLLFDQKIYGQENHDHSHDHLNANLLSAHAWVVDQFYIDSILVENKLNPIYHYYSDGGFVRGQKDTLVTGMYWKLMDANTIKISTSDQSYTESVDILFLSPCVLVTKQLVKGSDGNIYHLEHRFKPYIKPVY